MLSKLIIFRMIEDLEMYQKLLNFESLSSIFYVRKLLSVDSSLRYEKGLSVLKEGVSVMKKGLTVVKGIRERAHFSNLFFDERLDMPV